ncbi:phosphate ABC transporter permease subunit PstC [Iamia majanohamensis]|uniref:Phosphate transport system permease protein n=1 Tax=Iamia majanohamensis TaxID=467976 RepID=A0AAE9Y6E3_9ACTN|nr:phosphate ABC transporter permease subunit PstC [Iamia majanohamensis]WCO67530.1 phosphate ABC transporter permease subunit PstC [Iamia majanohamensis]
MTALPPEPRVTLADLSRQDGRTAVDRVVSRLLAGAGLLAIVISLLIIWTLTRDALAFLTDVDLSLLWGDVWSPRSGRYGIQAPLTGTLWVTLVGTMIAGPLGLGAAIYLSEYASSRVRRIVKPVIEVLASIPSVVVGVFAFRFIAPQITQRLFSGSPTLNLMVAGIGVGLLSIPLMASVSEDALRAVPAQLREASYGLGARKITTVTKVVVPAAISGLVAALILTISRAVGETMVVFLAAGGSPTTSSTPLESGITITSAMTGVLSGSDQQVGGTPYQSVFFLGLCLFFLTLVLNLVADRFVRRVRQTY